MRGYFSKRAQFSVALHLSIQEHREAAARELSATVPVVAPPAGTAKEELQTKRHCLDHGLIIYHARAAEPGTLARMTRRVLIANRNARF